MPSKKWIEEHREELNAYARERRERLRDPNKPRVRRSKKGERTRENVTFRGEPEVTEQISERSLTFGQAMRLCLDRYLRLMKVGKAQLRRHPQLADSRSKRALVNWWRKGGEQAVMKQTYRLTTFQQEVLLDCIECFAAAEDAGKKPDITTLLD